MVPTFRYAIMSADDGEPQNPSSNYHYSIDDDNLLHQLQNMYTYLTFSDKMDYNPGDFCYSYKDFDGNPINVRAQQDSQEFYNNLCDKIENCLKKTKYKYIVSDVFSGKTCSSVMCENCKHLSNRFEDFYNLTLEVKNIDNLKDSLQKLNVPEIIDDFKCSNCDKKVTIKKVTSLNKLPNVLVVHLKRFYLNYETCHTQKINSKFEFPKKLNLKQFCVEEITKNISKNEEKPETQKENETLEIYNREDSYYEYELKGINVHTGSADGGHYFSFIDVNRDGKKNLLNDYSKENWLQFNDSHVSVFDTDTIPNECYGGSSEGHSYENCQNAYLLIYERKKKTPIKIIIDESKIDKEKDKDLIIKIDKDNKAQIYKEYDLNRINTDKKEEDLYSKIFFDQEKNEYFKYIPYYDIPKYAPRKVYNEIMKENNSNPSLKQDNKNNNANYKKYKGILLGILNRRELDITDENYDEKSKEIIISLALNDFSKAIKANQIFDENDKREINSVLNYMIEKLIKPLIKKDTNISLLKVINKAFTKDVNVRKIFYCKYGGNRRDDIINIENSKDIKDILYDLAIIFFDKKNNGDYFDEFKNIYRCIYGLIRNYTQSTDDDSPEEEYGNICIYELLNSLVKVNEKILEFFLEKGIISTLLDKIENENKRIRNIIYDTVIYAIKKTKDYSPKFFDFNENEKRGTYEFEDKDKIKSHISEPVINTLFQEKIDLLILLVNILLRDDIKFSFSFFYTFIHRFYSYYKEKDKINDLMDIFLTLVKINDTCTFERLYNIMGYPNLIIKQIPKNEKDFNNHYYEGDSDSDDSNKNNQKENKNENPDEPTQRWPIFGERLINGDINRHIYEYLSLNHRDSGMCLLGLLFPRENIEADKDSKNYEIPKEIKKNVILDLLKNCFEEKKNYSLFKYIYLNPARSLKYQNLYEEMIYFLQEEDSAINLEKYNTIKEKYLLKIEKEIKESIKKAKKERHYYDNNNSEDSDNTNENQSHGKEEFECFDESIKRYIGFNPDIIPGEIVREEIQQIAQTRTLAMYRIHYYTKYFNRDELRNSLLKNSEKKEEENKKNDENKEKEEDKKETANQDPKKEENKPNEEEKKQENKETEKDKEIDKDKEKSEGDNTENKKENETDSKEDTKKDEVNKEKTTEEKEEKEKENKEGEEKKEDGEKKEGEEKKEDGEKKEEKKENEEEEEEKNEEKEAEENIETEIDGELDKKNHEKRDISECTENNFIYRKSKLPIILEDKTLKDKNKVKSTLIRFVFTNEDVCQKSFKAKIKRSDIKEIVRLNCFLPQYVFDKIKAKDMTNFFNVIRIKSDLPFMNRDDGSINIDMGEGIQFD